MLTFPGAELLDAVGPLEVFAQANALTECALYDLHLVAPAAGRQIMSSGLALAGVKGFEEAPGKIDTLLVAGGAGARKAIADREVQAWLGRQARSVRRLGSVCTGAYVLAAGGYLDGRRATTHWARCAEFARLFPKVQVEPDAIFVRDGNIITSAGITAGMDLALSLVEEDHGRGLAFDVARNMVIYARRAGGQSQFSVALRNQAQEGGRFDALQCWILDNLKEDLSVERLAEQAVMSPRSFARHFVRDVGVTPARFVELARLEAARRALEESDLPIEVLAQRTGFGQGETLRRAFRKHLSMNPKEYRRRWTIAPESRPGDGA